MRWDVIKRIFGDILGYDGDVLELKKKLKTQEDNVKYYMDKFSACGVDKIEVKNELQSLKDQFLAKNHPRKEFWDRRKPMAKVFYGGRPIPFTKDMIPMDVRLFVQPQDHKIQESVKKSGILIDTPLVCQDEILDLYRWHQKIYFKYEYDSQNFEIPELWLFPFELLQMRDKDLGGDCEDFSHSIASHLIAAGVPSWRVRIVCGMTWTNFGHSTVYFLGDDLKTWYHINSTTPLSMIPCRVADLPKSNDPMDTIGIREVWFSFNNYGAWHTFETGGAEKSFRNEIKHIKILPIQ